MDMDNKTTAERLRELAVQVGGWRAALIHASADDLEAALLKLDAAEKMFDEVNAALGAADYKAHQLESRLDSVRSVLYKLHKNQFTRDGEALDAIDELFSDAEIESVVERQCGFPDCGLPSNGPLKFWCDQHELWITSCSTKKICPYCSAPDNGTCAYPSEGKPGCFQVSV